MGFQYVLILCLSQTQAMSFVFLMHTSFSPSHASNFYWNPALTYSPCWGLWNPPSSGISPSLHLLFQHWFSLIGGTHNFWCNYRSFISQGDAVLHQWKTSLGAAHSHRPLNETDNNGRNASLGIVEQSCHCASLIECFWVKMACYMTDHIVREAIT